jgi:hypothetical protein
MATAIAPSFPSELLPHGCACGDYGVKIVRVATVRSHVPLQATGSAILEIGHSFTISRSLKLAERLAR